MKTIETKADVLKEQLEKRIGITLCDSCFEEALAYGRQKLERIISLYGDDNGTRLECWYLVELMSEYISMQMINVLSRLEMAKRKDALPASRCVN